MILSPPPTSSSIHPLIHSETFSNVGLMHLFHTKSLTCLAPKCLQLKSIPTVLYSTKIAHTYFYQYALKHFGICIVENLRSPSPSPLKHFQSSKTRLIDLYNHMRQSHRAPLISPVKLNRTRSTQVSQPYRQLRRQAISCVAASAYLG
jgi:hypothetical protein